MENGYALCLNKWALDKEIKNELGLLLIISSLCAEKGYCFASNKYFAELFDTKEETISRKIKFLEQKKYLIVDYVYRGCEIKSRNIRLTKISIDDYQKYQSTIDKNVKDNNTSINITSINNNNNTIYEFIETNFSRTLSPIEYEQISLWDDTDLTRYAIKQSVLSGKCNIKYIDRILQSYKRENVKTVQQAQERENDFNNKKELKTKQRYEPRKSYQELERERFDKMLEEVMRENE